MLAGGSLVVHSPGPLTADEFGAIERLGDFLGLIGPNLMHHRYLPAAQQRWPDATLVAPSGLRAKRPDLRVDIELTETAAVAALPAAWGSALVPFHVGGMPRLAEYAFLHRDSETLLLTDLAFNVCAPKPMWPRAFMQLNGGWDRFGPTRVLKSAVKDAALAREGIRAIVTQPFTRVLVAHGAIVEHDTRQRLVESYRWLLQ